MIAKFHFAIFFLGNNIIMVVWWGSLSFFFWLQACSKRASQKTIILVVDTYVPLQSCPFDSWSACDLDMITLMLFFVTPNLTCIVLQPNLSCARYWARLLLGAGPVSHGLDWISLHGGFCSVCLCDASDGFCHFQRFFARCLFNGPCRWCYGWRIPSCRLSSWTLGLNFDCKAFMSDIGPPSLSIREMLL